MMTIASVRDAITANRAWYCLECGKCSAVCPITRWEQRAYTSPRLLVEKAIEGRTDDLLDDYLFWSCLTCKRCSELCPSEVNFSEFLRDVRGLALGCDRGPAGMPALPGAPALAGGGLARGEGRSGEGTHGDAMRTWGRIMTRPGLHPDRLGWLSGDLRISERSDTVYFVGCLPFFDPMFKKLGAEGVEIAQAAVRILNRLGIEPQVLADERCCGHDQLWEGDLGTFRALASLNLERLSATGARRIVTTCPECARTLKIDYPQYVGRHNLQVLHLSELVAASSPIPGAAQAGQRITYQDPCRLGRHLGVYDAPRQVLAAQGLEIAEMERVRKASLCCGTSCWTSCGQVSKNIQVERLREARATGAELLVTACVKCQIHFRCAQDDPALGDEIRIPIRDWTTVVAERL